MGNLGLDKFRIAIAKGTALLTWTSQYYNI